MPYTAGIWRPHDWRDWELELIDGSLDTIGGVDEAYGAKLVWALYGYGDGAFSLHVASERAADLLANENFYVRAIRDGVQIRDFMVAKDDFGYTVANQFVDEYIQISLAPLDAILKDHVCLPASVAPDDIFTSPSLPIDDGLKWIVDHVAGPNAYDSPLAAPRSITGLVIAANLSAHPTTQTIDQAHGMDLFDFLQKYGPNWGVHWRVRMERMAGIANQMVFETIYPTGLDKTLTNGVRQPVLLNDASGEMPGARRYRPRIGFANAVLAKDRTTEVTDAASIAAFGRHEFLAGENDGDRLDAALEEKSQRIGDEVDFAASEMMMIGTGVLDIGPGDEISVGCQHLGIATHDEFVNKVDFELTREGQERAAITLGRYEKTLSDKIDESAGGGSGGGGGTAHFDPIEGLKDNAGLFVPFSNADDYIWVQLLAGTGLSIVGNVAGNSLAITLVPGSIDHGALGGLADDDHTQYLLTSGARALTGNWDAGAFIVTAERFTVGTGAYIESDAPGTSIRLNGTTYAILVVAGVHVVYADATSFTPSSASTVALGKTAAASRFNGLFVKADVDIATGVGIVHADATTAGQVLRYNGTRFVPAKLAITDLSAQHTHTITGSTALNTNFVNRGISEDSGYPGQTWIWCNDNNSDPVTGGYWAQCVMSDGDHTHPKGTLANGLT